MRLEGLFRHLGHVPAIRVRCATILIFRAVVQPILEDERRTEIHVHPAFVGTDGWAQRTHSLGCGGGGAGLFRDNSPGGGGNCTVVRCQGRGNGSRIAHDFLVVMMFECGVGMKLRLSLTSRNIVGTANAQEGIVCRPTPTTFCLTNAID